MSNRRHRGLVCANYIRTYADDNSPINLHVKSVVNPQKVVSVNNPHFAIYKYQACAVDENFSERLEDRLQKLIHHLKIKINHYHCKSKAEYLLKLDKWCADVKKKENLTNAQ
ncbi:MAG: hypothetical protein ACLSA2_02810 [Candidatus Gastranaerophilaceae bacterium]